MPLARTRSLFFLAFIACALIIGTVVYLQRVFDLTPCVLCVWQRWVFLICAALALAAAWHGPGPNGCRRYGALMLVLTLSGGAIAGTQVWLQTATPDELVPVIAAIERSLDALFLGHVVERLRFDTLLCAEINWSLFGMTLPEWSLLAFVGLALLALYPIFQSSGKVSGAESRAED
jgi:disulfide bond formation protein DsbB